MAHLVPAPRYGRIGRGPIYNQAPGRNVPSVNREILLGLFNNTSGTSKPDAS